jgi:hypothetical protein
MVTATLACHTRDYQQPKTLSGHNTTQQLYRVVSSNKRHLLFSGVEQHEIRYFKTSCR